jgi:hypothetical protein
MRGVFFALALVGAAATAASAQDAIPDLKGTWTGKGKSIVYGTNLHHPGSQSANDAPRVRDIEATYQVEGQDGRLAWGHSSSTAANTQEPFAWAMASDNKSIIGSDRTATSISRWFRPTAWRNATSTTAPARPIRWWRPATRWIA